MTVQEYVLSHLAKGNRPLNLRTVNGTGFSMFGFSPVLVQDEKVLGLSLHALCFFFIPIFPFGLYLIERVGTSYNFYGSVPLRGCLNALGVRGSFRFGLGVLKDVLLNFAFLVPILVVLAILLYALR